MKNLDNRLKTVASMVRQGTVFADIGTDHAHIPIYLIENNICKRGYASDIKKGPLESAGENIQKAGLAGKIELKLSDGLSGFTRMQADDIIIAGIGGELIVKILQNAPFVKDQTVNLVLQPMSKEEALRIYLAQNGFQIISEQAVEALNRVYICINAVYSGKIAEPGPLFQYTGGLDFSQQASKSYLLKQIKKLSNKRRGLNKAGKTDEANTIGEIIVKLRERVKE